MSGHDEQFDPKRKEELLQKLMGLPPEKAHAQIALIPTYQTLEGKITKPKQGIFVSSYFLTKWAPTLGHPATQLVLTLQKLSNKDGETFASQQKIAAMAGVGLTTLRLWLTTNPERWKARSPEQRRQWELLHAHFLKQKKRRFRQRMVDGQSRTVQTTNLYHIIMEDPIHPDDYPAYYALAAEEIANAESRKRQKEAQNNGSAYGVAPRLHRDETVIIRDEDETTENVDNPPYGVAPRLFTGSRVATALSSSYRSKNVSNVSETEPKNKNKSLRSHPVIQAMTSEEKAAKEFLTRAIGEQLTSMNAKLARQRGASDPYAGMTPVGAVVSPELGTEIPQHKDYGFHWIVAHFVPQPTVAAALMATEDAVEDQIQGKRGLSKSPDRYFTGVLKIMCREQGIDVPISSWKTASEATS